jgi:hypothetical protein
MLEILALFILCKHIGKAARAKKRPALSYQLLLGTLWVVGEFIGGLLAGVGIFLYSTSVGNLADEAVFIPYRVALSGAVLGAKLAFRFVRRLPDQPDEEPISPQENFVNPGIATGGTASGTSQL